MPQQHLQQQANSGWSKARSLPQSCNPAQKADWLNLQLCRLGSNLWGMTTWQHSTKRCCKLQLQKTSVCNTSDSFAVPIKGPRIHSLLDAFENLYWLENLNACSCSAQWHVQHWIDCSAQQPRKVNSLRGTCMMTKEALQCIPQESGRSDFGCRSTLCGFQSRLSQSQ